MLENKSDQSLVEDLAERLVRVRAGIAAAGPGAAHGGALARHLADLKAFAPR